MSGLEKSGLSTLIEGKLRSYFESLDGDAPVAHLYDHIMREVERPLLSIALEKADGQKGRAAEILGINRNTLRKKLLELGGERAPS